MDPQRDSTNTLGQRVRSLRTEFRLSQQELARRARVSQPRISQIESGTTPGPMPLRMLCDLADGLGVDLDGFIAGDPTYDTLDLDEVRSLSPPASTVTRPSVTLVGRADDLTAVVSLVRAGVRLLTLVGPGGVGKTQLAIHAARELENDFPRGMFFVSLAACVDPGCVVSTIGRSVRLRERDAQPLRSRLLSDLPAGRILLVLDNVEQAASPVAELSVELLAAYPGLSLLVTSRAPLNIRDERQHVVHPLGFPNERSPVSAVRAAATPAVELFVQRVRAVLPGFALTNANASQVTAICQRLDGLPLAIELAAPRVRVFSSAQLLRQLERRLTFVMSGSRDLPARQRSLRANVAWSFDLLDTEHQALLRRLAVFVGGFSLDAAAELAEGDASHSPDGRRSVDEPGATTGEGLTVLLDQHLLKRAEDAQGVPRFDMLETIHEYAREQLEIAGEAADYSERHLAWCLSMAELSVPKMFTAEEPAWLDRLQREDANLQAALDWSFGPGVEIALEEGLRLAGALADYWYLTGSLSDGRDCLTRAIALSAERAPSIGRARCLVASCLIAQTQAVVELAQAHGEQGLIEATMLDDRPTIGRALLLLGNLAMMDGDLQRARGLHEKALARFRHLDDRAWTALALANLGMDSLREGHLDQAASYTEDALAIARAIGNISDTINTLRVLGEIARDRGNLSEAAELFVESLDLSWRHASERDVADSLSGLGAVAVAAGDLEQGARRLGAAEQLYQRLEISIPPPLRPDWTDIVDQLRNELGGGRFLQVWASTTPEQAVHDAIRGRET